MYQVETGVVQLLMALMEHFVKKQEYTYIIPDIVVGSSQMLAFVGGCTYILREVLIYN